MSIKHISFQSLRPITLLRKNPIDKENLRSAQLLPAFRPNKKVKKVLAVSAVGRSRSNSYLKKLTNTYFAEVESYTDTTAPKVRQRPQRSASKESRRPCNQNTSVTPIKGSLKRRRSSQSSMRPMWSRQSSFLISRRLRPIASRQPLYQQNTTHTHTAADLMLISQMKQSVSVPRLPPAQTSQKDKVENTVQTDFPKKDSPLCVSPVQNSPVQKSPDFQFDSSLSPSPTKLKSKYY